MLMAFLLSGGLQAADPGSLTQRLVSTDNRQHETALNDLSALPPERRQELVTVLIPMLHGTDAGRRERVAEVLQVMGPLAAKAIPDLKQNLSDDFPYVRIRSAEALAHMGPAALQALVEALQNDNHMVRLVAVQALAQLGAQAKPAIPVLARALDDKEVSIRQQAATALENCGADASPVLMLALGNPAFKNRVGLVEVLGAIDGTPPHLPAQLTPFLSDSDPDLRLAAVKALTHKGQTSVSAVSLTLSSENALVRTESADILADIGPEASSAVPRLIGLLKDPDAHVRASSAHALGKMREAGTPAIPALREALRDADRDVATRAQEALTALTVTSGGPHEIKDGFVSSAGPGIPESSHRSKPKPKPNLPLPSKKPHVVPIATPTRLQASYLKLDSTASIHALEMSAQKGISEVRSAALAALASLLQSPDDRIREAAASALARVGTEDARKILDPYLKQEELKKINRLMGEIQKSTDSVKGAIDGLAAMGPVVVPAVTKALKDTKTTVRLSAAQIFTRLGPAASAAVPRLIDALNDKEETVRRQVSKALEVMNSPEAKNPLRIYYIKEKIRPYLKRLNISI